MNECLIYFIKCFVESNIYILQELFTEYVKLIINIDNLRVTASN